MDSLFTRNFPICQSIAMDLYDYPIMSCQCTAGSCRPGPNMENKNQNHFGPASTFKNRTLDLSLGGAISAVTYSSMVNAVRSYLGS
jgi:hypothetical protein